LLLATPAANASAQIRDPILGTRTAITTSPDTTILALTHRIEALESLVAALQQKTAFIKSSNPLVLDAGSDLTIRGNAVVVEAGTTLGIRSGSNASIMSSSRLDILASTILDLSGRPVRHNGGTSPIACAPSMLQVVACDTNVTMMGPTR
jgi:hypothetical protein